MRKDQCLFCKSRKCSCRVVSSDKKYDEVSCYKHVDDLYRHSDETAPGVMKWFINGTGNYSRGEELPE